MHTYSPTPEYLEEVLFIAQQAFSKVTLNKLTVSKNHLSSRVIFNLTGSLNITFKLCPKFSQTNFMVTGNLISNLQI